MRAKLDQELDSLMDAMGRMSRTCVSSIQETIDALTEGNHKKAWQVMEETQSIRRDEREVENICLKLLLQQQPVASDLRVVSAALKSVYDLERTGIVTGDIAEIIVSENVSAANDILSLKSMGRHACRMVEDAAQAFIQKNVELAESVIRNDDEVDKAFASAKKVLVEKFTHDGNVEYALNLLMIAKYFEKIGDHAVNIAEWAGFAANGKKLEAE